jgi:hypothetical protein
MDGAYIVLDNGMDGDFDSASPVGRAPIIRQSVWSTAARHDLRSVE